MKKVLILLITWYKLYRVRQVPACRFLPSCSDHALKALDKYSLVEALYKIVRRLLRCHPWHKEQGFILDEP